MSKKNNRAVCGCAATNGRKDTRAGVSSFRLHDTRNVAVRQLAIFAERRANDCTHPRKREKFARLAKFLKSEAQQ